MAITSTIITHTITGTITGSIYLDGITLIDQLTYTNSPGIVTCVENGEVTVSINDFLQLLKFYIAFNNVIIASIFNPSQSQYTPFTPIVAELGNDGIDQLFLTYQLQSESLPIFEFTCTYPSGDVIVAKRNPEMVLSYAQWLKYMYIVSDFRNFVLNAYNL